MTQERKVSGRGTKYVVVWWMAQRPCVAVFDHEVSAEAAANVRNGVVITISGRDLRVDGVVDWYRRDEAGHPMPAEWRDLEGFIHTHWLRQADASEAEA